MNNFESKTTPVLDAGYIKLVECWGSDERIIEAARMSTNKGFVGWDTDAKLLKFLYANHHDTPFEMAGAIIEVKAPIFVFREWHRHRTQSYNEMSARYTPLPSDDYLPPAELVLERANAATGNKQAQGTGAVLTEDAALAWREDVRECYLHIERLYQRGLREGIPKELARLVVPVGRYSRMRASTNLRNWLNFLRLRTALNAQWEIRQYADALANILRGCFPRTMQLFDNEIER
jgi:thymidylate synthase (FAD)